MELREYEVMLLQHAETASDKRAANIERIKKIVEDDKGTWLDPDDWGRRRLAYEIDHQDHAWYTLLKFDSTPETLAEVTRVLNILDDVIRYLAVDRINAEDVERTARVEVKRGRGGRDRDRD